VLLGRRLNVAAVINSSICGDTTFSVRHALEQTLFGNCVPAACLSQQLAVVSQLCTRSAFTVPA